MGFNEEKGKVFSFWRGKAIVRIAGGNMDNKKISNYENLIELWRQKFLKMDQEKLIKKFDLEADENSLYLVYFSRKLQINRRDGRISDVRQPERRLGFDTVITIYNMFHYAIEHPIESGHLVPFREVKRVYPFEVAYRRTILKQLSNTFSGHVQELAKACEALGGIKMAQGDAGYILPVFPFLHIAVLFWDGDEEFEAQGNMLFDSNITDFFHEENVVCIAADVIYYLTVEAGMGGEEIYAAEI